MNISLKNIEESRLKIKQGWEEREEYSFYLC